MNKIIVHNTNNPIAEDEILEQFVFADDGTFDKMLDSKLFRQIREKCDSYFLDRGEEQILEGTQIDMAIELIEKNLFFRIMPVHSLLTKMFKTPKMFYSKHRKCQKIAEDLRLRQ